MKTEKIVEKAREYSNKINRLSPEHSDNTICPITPKELKRYTIKDFISGAEWMNQQWQEKVKLSTSLIEQSLDNLKNTNYEIDRRDLYKVIYDALEIIKQK